MMTAGRRVRVVTVMGGLALCAASTAVAAAAGADATPLVQDAPGPGGGGLVPQRLVWPGIAVIVVVAVFATAALAGPLIRANSDDEVEAPAGPKTSDHVR